MKKSNTESELVQRLRAGDQEAFRDLIQQHHTNLVRFASTFVRTRATAEEVVQESWLGVLKGIESFEGRSALKSWIFSIVANRARSRAVREGRTVLFSELVDRDPAVPAVDPARFDAAGYWDQPPRAWEALTPERLAHSTDIRRVFHEALDELPKAQRAVVALRDVEGLDSAEVCNILEITETNQRVLLHRGRSRLRERLAPLLERP